MAKAEEMLERLLAGLASRRRPVRVVRKTTDDGWMWPFPGTVRRWIAEELDRIEAKDTR